MVSVCVWVGSGSGVCVCLHGACVGNAKPRKLWALKWSSWQDPETMAE